MGQKPRPTTLGRLAATLLFVAVGAATYLAATWIYGITPQLVDAVEVILVGGPGVLLLSAVAGTALCPAKGGAR